MKVSIKKELSEQATTMWYNVYTDDRIRGSHSSLALAKEHYRNIVIILKAHKLPETIISTTIDSTADFKDLI
jgi:hypothetical protein